MDQHNHESQKSNTGRNGMSHMPRHWKIVGMTGIAGSLLLGSTLFMHDYSGVSAAHAAQGSNVVAANAAPAGGMHGRGDFGRFQKGKMGMLYTVTAVSGSTITATDRMNRSVTITVSGTTTYSEAGASSALSDIHAGSHILVQGTRNSNTAVAASKVEIVLPREGGVVTNVNGSTLSITSQNGATHTINVSSSTRYTKAGQSAALSDITNGTAIMAVGNVNGDGSLAAVAVTIQVPHVAGKVTAANNGSFTIAGGLQNKNTVTVNTSSSTVYVGPLGTTVSASTIVTGTRISAEGTLSADGKTLTALRITVMPAVVKGQMGMGMAPGAQNSAGTAATGNA